MFWASARTNLTKISHWSCQIKGLNVDQSRWYKVDWGRKMADVHSHLNRLEGFSRERKLIKAYFVSSYG